MPWATSVAPNPTFTNVNDFHCGPDRLDRHNGPSDLEPDVGSFVLAWAMALATSWPQRRWSAPCHCTAAKTGAPGLQPNPLLRGCCSPKRPCRCIHARRRLPLGPQPACQPVPVQHRACAEGCAAGTGPAGNRALRQLLVDVQIQQTAKPGPRSTPTCAPADDGALDASTLREVSSRRSAQPRLPAAHHSQRGRGARRPAQ